MQYSFARYFMVAFALLAGGSFAFCQLPDYHVKMITEQQGLKIAEFTSIAKDKKGFLWLVAQNNVQRYDGKQSWSFPIEEVAEEIFIDNKDRIWLITGSGVQLYINDYAGFRNISHSSGKEGNPICMFNHQEGLYLVMRDGLQVFNEQQQQFVLPGKPVLKVSRTISVAKAADERYLFFASADSIYSFDLVKRQLTSLNFRHRVQSFVALSGNDILISVSRFRTYYANFDTRSVREIEASEMGTAANIKFILVYNGIRIKQDQYLLSTTQGLFEFDYCNLKFRKPVFYYRGDRLNNLLSVRWLFKDEDGLIYMTHADGIVFYNPQVSGINYLRNYTSENASLPDIDVRSFAQDSKGDIWIATLNGLASLDMKTGRLKTLFASKVPDSIDYPSIRHLVFHNDFLWIGTGGKGVWLYRPETGKFKRPVFAQDSIGQITQKTFTSEFAWRLTPLANGDVFFAGGNYCYVIKHRTLLVTRLSRVIFPGISRSATQDSSGRVWRGTASGLSCTDSSFKLLFTIKDSLPDKRVAAFCEWKKNHMLIGTKGVYEVKTEGNKIVAFNRLPWSPQNRFVYCMERDKLGRIWMGTEEGLYRYDPFSGKTEKYGSADNVQPLTFNSNGLYMAPNNLMFAGGKSGMNYFDPLRIQSRKAVLKPTTVSFIINDDDSSFFIRQQPFKIAYTNRNISINISAPDYENPFGILYRYKLKKNSSKWIENGNSRFVRLNNLSPGHYEFTASASRDGKQWFVAGETVSFKIELPWWRQWWFIGLILVTVAMLLWVLYKMREERKRQKEHQRTIDYFAHSGFEHSSVDDILWDIARNCISGLGFEDCVIYLVDRERNMLVQKAAYGPKSPKSFEIINPIEIPIGKGITGHVALTGIAEIVNDTSTDSRYVVDDEKRLSEITVPIIHQDRVLGVIDSESRKKNFFTKRHLETLKTIASICSAKISRAMAVAEMQGAERQLSELNTKMLETKFMNLRLQMNPHFLFNSLSSIQHLIVSQQTNEAYKYLSVFSTFLRSVLQYADKTVIKLDEELKMLDMYIRLELLGSDKVFEYAINVDEQLEPEDILVPPLIIQPVVENAIWHGLMHKEGSRKLSVSFQNNADEHMVCIVEDNGIGRSEASSISKKNLNNFAYHSKSTALIRERLQLLTVKTGKPAGIEVEDKLDHGKVAGTIVKIIIPFYNPDEV